MQVIKMEVSKALLHRMMEHPTDWYPKNTLSLNFFLLANA